MIIKQSISLLVLSAILVLPGIAQAGSVDVQTGNMRTTIDRDRDVKVKNGNSTVFRNPADRDRDVKVKNGNSTVFINPARRSPNYRRDRLNSRLKHHPWSVRRNQNTCKGGSYSSQSTQTSVSNNGVTRTRSSESTVCN